MPIGFDGDNNVFSGLIVDPDVVKIILLGAKVKPGVASLICATKGGMGSTLSLPTTAKGSTLLLLLIAPICLKMMSKY